ncbi:cytochrome P450 [Zopfia rhizophila CBS 207.26]|uniref:Cytochrome P450 n=1 Tax=Zopfia rhizophila CBS 207.26 TaxID=1314779 RepID=A0A6A6DGT5_9PEZI|nr:cytochrome P450 [Zopfia rhizophila CBS 207.26]
MTIDSQSLEAGHICLSIVAVIILYAVLLIVFVTYSLFFLLYSHVPGPRLCKLSRHWVTFFDLRRQRPEKVAEWLVKYRLIIHVALVEVSIADSFAMRDIYSSSRRHEKSHYFDHFMTHNERSISADIEDRMRGWVVAVLDRIERQLACTESIDIFPLFSHFTWENFTSLLWNNARFNLPPVYKLGKLIGMVFTRFRNTQRISGAASDLNIPLNHSLLRRLHELEYVDGKTLSSDYITCGVLDNLHAAQATVTVSLTYVLYYLSRNAEWQDRSMEEIDGLPKEVDGFPSFATINAAPILEACIRKAYRLNLGSSGRAERAISFGKKYAGVFLPENIIVSASTIAFHYNATVFPSPSMFDPNRWLETSPEQLRTQGMMFIPFGYAARFCLGKAFATLEIKPPVAALYLRYSTHVDESTGMTTKESMRQAGTQDVLLKRFKMRHSFRKAYLDDRESTS